MRRMSLLLFAVLVSAAHANPPVPCSTPEHRQFDFWLGDWRVHTPDGKFAGLNRITREYGGCVIHERYATGRGYSGESVNVYDASRKVWHQTWVDDTGLLLTLEGRWDGRQMILEGHSPGSNGERAPQRITWTPNLDGSLRQLWESADSAGKWAVVFDGQYTNANVREPVKLESTFSAEEVAFVKQPGTATVTGKAFLKLADGSYKNCAGFNIELLPVAAYSNERIRNTYGNNQQGQILLEQHPPKFTPDVPEYHELLLKGACDASGKFRFNKVPAGEYYVMAFIIWDDTSGATPRKTGGAVMRRIQVAPGSKVDTLLRN